MTARICSVVALLALLCPLRVDAGVPRLLNYQGQLQTASDSLVTGTVQVVFSIYDAADGGAALWTEAQSIQAADGRFSVLLGSVSAFPEGLFSEGDRYLALTVGDDAELFPRQRIVSSAYALRAAQADNVAGRDVSPASLTLSGGGAALDSTGSLTARRVAAAELSADSLIVGGKGIVDRNGNWTGAPMATQTSGMVLDTIVVKSAQDTITINPFDGQWRALDDLRTLLTLEASSLLDAQFTGVLMGGEWFETRMRLKSAGVQDRRTIGNVSGVRLTGQGQQSAPIMNLAVVPLAAGSYFVDIEYRGAGPVTGLGAAIDPILLIRVYSR